MSGLQDCMRHACVIAVMSKMVSSEAINQSLIIFIDKYLENYLTKTTVAEASWFSCQLN